MEPGRSAYNHLNIEKFLAIISLFRQQTLDSVDQPAQACTADLRIICSLIIKQKNRSSNNNNNNNNNSNNNSNNNNDDDDDDDDDDDEKNC